MHYSGINVNNHGKFELTDTKLYVPVMTLSTQGNGKLLQQLKTGFRRRINWNKYEYESTAKTRNWSLNQLIDPSLHGVNRLFVSSFVCGAYRRSYKRYFLPTVKIKDCSIMIEFFSVNIVVQHSQIKKSHCRQAPNF